MKREELFSEFDKVAKTLSEKDYYNIKLLLSTFLDENVCIPKGSARHPCADVLHEWVEGAICESDGITYKSRILESADIIFDDIEYRIKPSEPVYEYIYYDKDGKFDWLTNDEYELMMSSEPMECYKAEETKRERK